MFTHVYTRTNVCIHLKFESGVRLGSQKIRDFGLRAWGLDLRITACNLLV